MTDLRAAHEKLFDAQNRLRCADKSQMLERRREVYRAMKLVLRAEMKENK